MEVRPAGYDFGPMHASLRRHVEDGFLAMAAAVVLEGTEVVDSWRHGFRDREARDPIAADSIYRIYSNTKPITSVAAMALWEAGKFHLDDPIEKHLPELANLTALREGATDVEDAAPVENPPTIRQLFCHNAGFSYGFLLESPVDALYERQRLLSGELTLAEMVRRLGTMPLASAPGARFRYSVATDVLARLVEVWAGMRFDKCLESLLFGPLAMRDTGFHVPAGSQGRLCVQYDAADPMDPAKPGLTAGAADQLGGNYLQPKRFLSGGGGLVSTIGDYTRFMRMVAGAGELDGVRIVEAETLELMRSNQLPPGVGAEFPFWRMPDTVFGLGFAIKTAPAEGEPESAAGEYHWGGMAGTHSWISPAAGIAGIVFTQRMPGFWHPFSHDFKRLTYQAML